MSSPSTKKRSIASFFDSPQQQRQQHLAKKARISPPPTRRFRPEVPSNDAASIKDCDPVPPSLPPSTHPTYPHPIASLPAELADGLNFAPEAEARVVDSRPDLDLLYYRPFIAAASQRRWFEFLRAQLPFYRVKYTIKRGAVETQVNTPRYTTVFGVDDTAAWTAAAPAELIDARTLKPTPRGTYRAQPRPLPGCLDALRRCAEAVTGETFNFCLVNYYASGEDSISYHSDDERFLGNDPAIASFSLGARRDFLLRHKDKDRYPDPKDRDLKLELGSGDMVLMRGKTQSRWLHSIPKRRGAVGEAGRINITFRRALVRGGTDNYYRYNVGDGIVYRWDGRGREMRPWKDPCAVTRGAAPT